MVTEALPAYPVPPQDPSTVLARRLYALGPGDRLAVIGRDARGVAAMLREAPALTRGALVLPQDAAPESAADGLLDDLAAVALRLWPAWYGGDAAADPDPLALRAADPLISRPWLRAAVRRVSAGQLPRFRRVARGLELAQLLRAVAPAGLILIAAPDPVSPRRAAPVIAALEWAAAHGAAIVAAFPTPPLGGPPYDRMLYGALDLAPATAPLEERFIAPRARAHPASATEARVEAALRRDAELGPLFSANETVQVSPLGTPPRVDFLWRAGRVVVELDGPDHQTDHKFAADRHRDYELLVAGYLVLRLTNGQVETDLAHAIEKIRAVVRLRSA